MDCYEYCMRIIIGPIHQNLKKRPVCDFLFCPCHPMPGFCRRWQHHTTSQQNGAAFGFLWASKKYDANLFP